MYHLIFICSSVRIFTVSSGILEEFLQKKQMLQLTSTFIRKYINTYCTLRQHNRHTIFFKKMRSKNIFIFHNSNHLLTSWLACVTHNISVIESVHDFHYTLICFLGGFQLVDLIKAF